MWWNLTYLLGSPLDSKFSLSSVPPPNRTLDLFDDMMDGVKWRSRSIYLFHLWGYISLSISLPSHLLVSWTYTLCATRSTASHLWASPSTLCYNGSITVASKLRSGISSPLFFFSLLLLRWCCIMWARKKQKPGINVIPFTRLGVNRVLMYTALKTKKWQVTGDRW